MTSSGLIFNSLNHVILCFVSQVPTTTKNQDVFNPTTVEKKGRPAGLHPVDASQNNLHELARSKAKRNWRLQPQSLTARPWKMMLGRLLSDWEFIWVSLYFQGRCHVKLSGGYLKWFHFCMHFFSHTMILNCASKNITAQNSISAQNMAEETTRQTASTCGSISRSHH